MSSLFKRNLLLVPVFVQFYLSRATIVEGKLPGDKTQQSTQTNKFKQRTIDIFRCVSVCLLVYNGDLLEHWIPKCRGFTNSGGFAWLVMAKLLTFAFKPILRTENIFWMFIVVICSRALVLLWMFLYSPYQKKWHHYFLCFT